MLLRPVPPPGRLQPFLRLRRGRIPVWGGLAAPSPSPLLVFYLRLRQPVVKASRRRSVRVRPVSNNALFNAHSQI